LQNWLGLAVMPGRTGGLHYRDARLWRGEANGGGGSARDAVQCSDIRRLPARLHEAVMTTTPGLAAAAAAAARLSTEVSADWESIHMPTQIDGF